jgi:hypothetical protein
MDEGYAGSAFEMKHASWVVVLPTSLGRMNNYQENQSEYAGKTEITKPSGAPRFHLHVLELIHLFRCLTFTT